MPTGYLRSNAMPEGRMIQNNSKRTIATAVLESVITTHFPASRPQIGFVRTRNHFDAIWMPRFAQFEPLDGRTHGAAVLRFRLVALWWIDHGNCDLLLAASGLTLFFSRFAMVARLLRRLVRTIFLTSAVDDEDRDKRQNAAGFQNEK